MKTSIVILTYNKLDYTIQCIESIRQHTTLDQYELIVVDNHSTDGTIDWLKAQSDIITIYNQENLGFPKGCNQGIEIATGDNILLLNNDTIVTEKWLDNLVACLNSSEEIGAVGAVTNNCFYYQTIPVSYSNLKEMHEFAAIHNKSDSQLWEERLMLIGFCMLIKKSVIDQIGLLDERFSPGNYEDNDFSFRIRQEGYKLILCKDTFIHHYGSTSWKDNNSSFTNLLKINRQKFFDKWGFDSESSAVIDDTYIDFIDKGKQEAIRVLQIGAGCGGTLLKIKHEFKQAELYGIEPNIKAQQIADFYHSVEVNTLQDDIHISYPPSFFDVIIVGALDSSNSKQWLELAKKHLKDDGIILSNTPNLLYYGVIRDLIQGEISRSQLSAYTFLEIEEAFHNASLENLEITGFSTAIPQTDRGFIDQLKIINKSNTIEPYEIQSFLIKAKKNDADTSDIRRIMDQLMDEASKESAINKLTHYDQGFVIKSLETSYSNPVEQLNLLAVKYFEAGQYESVLPFLNKALELDKQDKHTLYNLGYILHVFGEDQLAQTYLDQIKNPDEVVQVLIREISIQLEEVAVTSDDVTLDIVRISNEISNEGELLQAIKSISDADNNRMGLLNQLAMQLYALENYEYVLTVLLHAIELEPDHADTLYNLAIILEQAGEFSLALQYMEKVDDKDGEVLHSISALKEKIGYAASIVIPVYNKLDYTKRCIEALYRNTPQGLYEIILIDNASTDSTKEYLQTLNGDVQIIINANNVGFLEASNQGARAARGKYIVFLNNDTEPQERWLEELIATAESDTQVGAVGAKLIYPNGVLQEAGSIIWSDATGWNYGKGDSPSLPKYNFIREVDYCSGACLLISKDLFERAGAFDTRYVPAYYEDTDLCFTVRQMGYKVIYNPRVEIIHYEGITSGTDESSGIKRYQAINRVKFKEKWAEVLKDQCTPSASVVDSAATRSRGKNILVIDPFLPLYDQAAGSLRLFNIIKILRNEGHQITFIARNGQNQRRFVDELERLGIEVYDTDAKKMKFLGYNVPGHQIDLELLLTDKAYDVVWLSFYQIAEQYLDQIRLFSPQSKIIIDSVDVQYVREARRAKVANDPKLLEKAEVTKQNELKMYSKADVVVAVTEVDANVLREEIPNLSTSIIPTIHDSIEKTEPFEQRDGLLFIGNFNHDPNIDAIQYFTKEVWPLVKELLPNLKFYIVGNRSEQLIHSDDPDIVVAGFVPDTQSYLQTCKVSVAPLRYGAGMKGKIGEAMLSGIPVVTTSIGSEGMNLEHEEHVLVADEPKLFAEAIVRLHEDEDLWNSMVRKSKMAVNERYGTETVTRLLQELV